MARSIAEAHGGILVAERPVSGAAFRVTLPAVAAASSTLAGPGREPPARTA
jgi:signal transduction histidine kinase